MVIGNYIYVRATSSFVSQSRIEIYHGKGKFKGIQPLIATVFTGASFRNNGYFYFRKQTLFKSRDL